MININTLFVDDSLYKVYMVFNQANATDTQKGPQYVRAKPEVPNSVVRATLFPSVPFSLLPLTLPAAMSKRGKNLAAESELIFTNGHF